MEVVDILTYHPLKQSFEECLNIAQQARPELKISSLRAEQAGKLVRIAQSEYFPALSLVGNYARFGDNPSVSGTDYKDSGKLVRDGGGQLEFLGMGQNKIQS